MQINERYIRRILAELIRINSVNPVFSGGTTSERAIAEYVDAALTRLGLETVRYEPLPGRTSVVGRLPGSGGGRSLLLYAHLDTVGIEGMPDAFSADIREGRMCGRGAYDMKGSLAACLAGIKALVDAGVACRRPAGGGCRR